MAKKKKASSLNGSPSKDKAAKKTLGLKEVKIRRHVSPDEKAVFSNHVVVRCDPAMFQLFFFDAQPAIAEEGDPGAVAQPDYAEAHCVSRVVIPHMFMPSLIHALQTNFERLPKIQKNFAEIVQQSIEKE